MSDDTNTQMQVLQPVEIIPHEDPGQMLSAELTEGSNKKYLRFTLAVLSIIPWVGSFINIAAGLSNAVADVAGESGQNRINQLGAMWAQQHEEKIKRLEETLKEIFERLNQMGAEVSRKVDTEEYLLLVKSAFRSWDTADTEEKRQLIKKLIINAASISLSDDDLIRLFIKWIDDYHEAHFKVIREIYRTPGISRGQIWDNLNTTRPAENSAQADLFKYLIRDLSTGGVIRQHRDVDAFGNQIRQTPSRSRGQSRSNTFESAFENSKPYELTELGSQFVHYVFDDVVTRIDQP